MSITWFRLYHDLPNDRKLRKFSPQQKWAWVVLLCLASESKQRGFVDTGDEEDLADYCGFESTQDFQYFLDKLRQKGMVEPFEGKLKITHWEDRQYEKPSDKPEAVRARVAKHRAKKKAEKEAQKSDESVTPCNALQPLRNADETPEQRESNTSKRIDTDPDPDPDPDPISLPLPPLSESGGTSLDSMKVQLNRLSVDSIPGTLRTEWRMRGWIPWKDRRTGDLLDTFAVFVGNKLMFKGSRESMKPLEKGRAHIRKSELSVTGMQTLIDYWTDYQKSKASAVNQPIETPESAPPPPGFFEKVKAARYQNAS